MRLLHAALRASLLFSLAAAQPASFASDYKRIARSDTASLARVISQTSVRPIGDSAYVLPVDTSCAVGMIPLSSEVTPTGALTCGIPIFTLPGCKLAPELSLSYNSMSSYGDAGAGWSLAGVSSVVLSPKLVPYDGIALEADVSDSLAVYSLDGVRLVPCSDSAMSGHWDWQTETGRVMVRGHRSPDGAMSCFDAAYPDGSRAVYGWPGNASPMAAYPVTERSDRFGHKIFYSYDTTYNAATGNSTFRVSSVRYGSRGDAEISPGEILVSYSGTARQDMPTAYYAGHTVSDKMLVDAVASIDRTSGDTLFRYSLTRTESGDGDMLLTGVEMENRHGERLNPVKFMYGSGDSALMRGSAAADFHVSTAVRLDTSMVAECDSVVFKRGKFVADSYEDGFIAYRGRSSYGSYPGGQHLAFAPGVDRLSSPIRIPLGAGFQTADPVDVDGDGVDEIVIVNFGDVVRSGQSSNRHLEMHVRTYSYDRDSDVLSMTDSATIRDHGFRSLSSGGYQILPHLFRYGDFTGTGRPQMLRMNVNTYYKTRLYLNCFTITDLKTRKDVWSDAYFFDLDYSDDAATLIVNDVDNDGVTEFCRAKDDTLYIYGYRHVPKIAEDDDEDDGGQNEDGSEDIEYEWRMALERALPIPTSAFDSRTLFGDFNSDGYMDIIAPQLGGVGRWAMYSYTGSALVLSTMSMPTYRWMGASGERSYNDKYVVMDIDRDGLPDLVRTRDSVLTAFLNVGGTFSDRHAVQSELHVSDTVRIIPCNSVRQREMDSFVAVDGASAASCIFSYDRGGERLLTAAIDSYGVTSRYSYCDMTADYAYSTDGSIGIGADSLYRRQRIPLYLVESSTSVMPVVRAGSLGRKTLSASRYGYTNSVIGKHGLGWRGFQRVTAADQIADGGFTDVTTASFDPEMDGVQTGARRAKRDTAAAQPHDAVFHEMSFSYRNEPVSGGLLNPVLVRRTETDSLTGVTAASTFVRDSLGFPIQEREARSCAGLRGHDVTVTRRSYRHVRDSVYILGLPLTEVSESTVSWLSADADAPGVRDSSAVSYGADSLSADWLLPVSSKRWRLTEVPDSSAWRAVLLGEDRTEGYDRSGNATVLSSCGPDGTAFVTRRRAYDTLGIHLTSYTDEFGQTTSYSAHDPVGGEPELVTDSHGLVTTSAHDGWGRKSGSLHPDGTLDSVSLSWGALGVYSERSCSTGSPTVARTFDAANRETDSFTQTHDGRWQRVSTAYDGKGRISSQSYPSIVDGTGDMRASSGGRTEYGYDIYSRPVSVTRIPEDDAGATVETMAYDGMTVTRTSSGITRSMAYDASGRMIVESDDGGTVTFSYRHDGRPSRISIRHEQADSAQEIVFGYDLYGNRSSISDPCAGVQTESVAYLQDGETVTTVANAFGTAVTYKDIHGRTYARLSSNTDIDGGHEESVLWSYSSSWPQLVTDMAVSDGSWSSLTYDALGRLASVQESFSDGKSLVSEYSYTDAGSLVAEVRRTDGDGRLIGTERRRYSNGHETGADFITGGADTINVWSLVSEDAWMRPRSALTGPLERLYTYDSHGLPAGRAVRLAADTSVMAQSLSYAYDAATGNMTMREDALRLSGDSFSYGPLGRLEEALSYGTSWENADAVSYMGNGNITSKGGVSMTYSDTDAYALITAADASSGDEVYPAGMEVKYGADRLPRRITREGVRADIMYWASGSRSQMTVADSSDATAASALRRLYFGAGGCQVDIEDDGSGAVSETWTLYLGGDAYSAPAAYVMARSSDSGEWDGAVRYIVRDVQGSVTCVIDGDGVVTGSCSYDAWGTPAPSGAGVGSRGYTGHEWLPWFDLYNANARLYSPALGRFLSPDPLVQIPDFSQSYNRYAYCLNNPLKYTDEDGESIFVAMAVGAAIFGAGNFFAHAIRGDNLGHGRWAKYMFEGAVAGAIAGGLQYIGWGALTALAKSGGTWGTIGNIGLYGVPGLEGSSTFASLAGGAITHGWKGVAHAGEILLGKFYLDENTSFAGAVWQGTLRHTWEVLQTSLGYDYSQFRNAIGKVDRVDYYRGVTFTTNEYSGRHNGMTLGNFINMNIKDNVTQRRKSFAYFVENSDQMYAHEFGHTIQSRRFGFAYNILAILSFGSAVYDIIFDKEYHDSFFTEVMANRYVDDLFKSNQYHWGSKKYPLKYRLL